MTAKGLGPSPVCSMLARSGKVFLRMAIVEHSRDPECDDASALLAQGITGKLTLCDGKTGRPRTIIDIEKAAKLTVEEGPHGPHFVKARTVGIEHAAPKLSSWYPKPGKWPDGL